MKNKMLLVFACMACGALSAAAQVVQSGGWKTSFGVDERLRVESKDNFDFNGSLDDSGGFMYQRLKLSAKAELPGKYELFAEGMDLHAVNAHLRKPVQEDYADLHQAYALVKGKVFGQALELKAGRQELKYGQGRMVWAATWGNRINHLDAAVLKYKSGGLSADAFYGSRVFYDMEHWNYPNRQDMLAGTYVSYRKSKDAPLVEGYYLSNFNSASLSVLNRQTVGLRGQFRLPGAVLCDLELPYQFGKSALKTVDAYAFHLDLSREFARAWSPRVAVTVNYATGDNSAADAVNHTFVPLYQAPHDPYGVMDFFRWQNMKEAALEVSVKPVKDLKITAGTNYFWLAQKKGSWYDSAGAVLRTSAAGIAGDYVGQEASLLVKYDLGGGAGLDGGYARFFAGEFVENTGQHDNADLLYFQFNLKL